MYIGVSIPNVITDVIILLLPLPYVFRLWAPVSQQLLLGGIIMLGVFVTVGSIIRFVVLLGTPVSRDVTYSRRELYVWSAIDIHVGLICACLPTLKPAWKLLQLDRLPSFLSSKSAESKGASSKIRPGHQPSNSNRTDRISRPRKRGLTGGLLSTLTGMSRLEDEDEDTYQMVKINADEHGKSDAGGQVDLRKSDTKLGSGHNRHLNAKTSQESGAINLPWQWSVQNMDRNCRNQ